MENNKTNYARIKLTGINTNKIINECISKNIEINNISKNNSQEIEFSIDDKNLKLLNALDLDNYNLEKIKPSMKERFFHFLVYRIGLIIGLIVSIIFIIIMQNRLLNINIYGLTSINSEDVIEKISELGINKFSSIDIDNEKVEKYLMDNFNFSFVSVITKGNSLIINVKEELPDISKSYLPITAEYNMIIKDIKVYSGTTNTCKGNVVFAGDELVLPYEYVNNEKIDVVPHAEIYGEVFFCASYNFYNEEEIEERTGESKIVNLEYKLGKFTMFADKKDNPYDIYDVEESDQLISDYFLPIHIKQTIVYEKEKLKVQHNFEEEKENIIENIRSEAYLKVPESLNVENEDIKINSTNYGNIVTIYLKSSVYLRYNN